MGIEITHGRLIIEESDGNPSGSPYKLIVDNSTLTDNGDGTFSLDTGGGGGSYTVTSKSSNYSMSNANELVLVSASGGNIDITLVDPSGVVGQSVVVKKTDSSGNTVIVASASGNIDGSANHAIKYQNQARIFTSDGTDWQITT